MPSKQNNYTDTELREQVKNEIHQGDKGGKPGQWSARKAQMTASEYKARGGDYTTSKEEKNPQQQHLDKWTDEEWQTKEGSGSAKQDDGTRKRYLPKKAWEGLSEGERQETEEKKVEGSKEGRQFVGNTAPAKRKRREVGERGKKDEEGGWEERERDKEMSRVLGTKSTRKWKTRQTTRWRAKRLVRLVLGNRTRSAARKDNWSSTRFSVVS